MNLHIAEMIEGFKETIGLLKAGADIFDMGGHSIFPTVATQQKWKFAKGDKFIRLSDGNQVYHFNMPEGEAEESDFPLVRGQDLGFHQLEADSKSKGLAQVHRSDPGSIYFTMQEGYRNPTYTFRHVGGDNWKAIPKKKAKKQSKESNNVIPNVNMSSVKQGMEEEFKKKVLPLMNCWGKPSQTA